ncbi:MAG: hypothetical protein ACPG4T_22505, partial [Nannocystaceae bacterium]
MLRRLLLSVLVGLLPGCDDNAHDEHEGHGDEHDEHGEHGGHSWVEARPPGDLSLLELPAHVQAGPESQMHVEVPFDGVVMSVSVEVGDP